MIRKAEKVQSSTPFYASSFPPRQIPLALCYVIEINRPSFVEKGMALVWIQTNVTPLFFYITDVSKVLLDLDETSKRRVDILDHFVVSASV